MDRKDFIKLTSGAFAFAAMGCSMVSSKGSGVDAVTSATPKSRWRPFPDAKKVRVVQWGMRHEHANGKFDSLKKLPDDYELVGIVDDLSSKTPTS